MRLYEAIILPTLQYSAEGTDQTTERRSSQMAKEYLGHLLEGSTVISLFTVSKPLLNNQYINIINTGTSNLSVNKTIINIHQNS